MASELENIMALWSGISPRPKHWLKLDPGLESWLLEVETGECADKLSFFLARVTRYLFAGELSPTDVQITWEAVSSMMADRVLVGIEIERVWKLEVEDACE